MSLTRAQLRSLIEDDIIDRSDKSTLVNYAINWGLELIDKTTTARGYTFADLNKEEITYTTISCDFETTAVDADTDLITVSIDIPTGTKIVFTSDDTVPTGLTASTDYWAIRASSTTIYVAETYLAAWQGTYVDIEDTGSGTHTVTAYRERLAKPDSCKHIYNIRLIDGASSRSLIAMPPRRLDLFKPFAIQCTVGKSTHYIEWKDWIQLYPIPDDTYVINIRYNKWMDAFDEDTDTAEVSHIDDIIAKAAAIHVWEILGEPEQASIMRNAVETALIKSGKLERMKPDLVIKPNMGSYSRSDSDTQADPFVRSQR